MKFSELFEASSARDIITKIYNEDDWYSDIIDKELNKMGPAHSLNAYSEKDYQKIKKVLENEIKNAIKKSIYNYIYAGIPDGLDIGKFTKKEFTDSLKTVSGKRIPVDDDGMPYEDVEDYDIIMDFYRKYVK